MRCPNRIGHDGAIKRGGTRKPRQFNREVWRIRLTPRQRCHMVARMWDGMVVLELQ